MDVLERGSEVTQRIFYVELVSRGDIKYLLHREIGQYPDWNHEVVGYTRTDDHRRGEQSSVLVKFWKEVSQ